MSIGVASVSGSDGFTIQDGGSGSGESDDDIGPGTYSAGTVFVWFDQGGFAEDGKNPIQGYYKTGDSTVPNKMFNYFVGLLEAKMGYHYSETSKVHWPSRWAALRTVMTNACKQAIRRAGGDTNQKARVVGVGLTWNNAYKEDDGGWQIGNYAGTDGRFTSIIKRAGTSSELKGASWDSVVDKNKYNGALTNENWRDYIYRIGAIDAPYDASDTWYVYAVAVTDDMDTGKIKIVKQPSY